MGIMEKKMETTIMGLYRVEEMTSGSAAVDRTRPYSDSWNFCHVTHSDAVNLLTCFMVRVSTHSIPQLLLLVTFTTMTIPFCCSSLFTVIIVLAVFLLLVLLL